MIQETKKEILLSDYANQYNIQELSSEDIIKLMTKPYLIKEIAETFNITEKEFNNIRKQKGITNITLENTARNIEAILYHLDSKNKFFSNKIRKKIVKILIKILIPNIPRKEFYIKNLSKIEFTREKVINDLSNKKIDINYRIENLSVVVTYIEKKTESLIKQEKEYLLNYNNKKVYHQLCNEKKNGKNFNKKDLTNNTLFELAIIENITDSQIALLYNISKTEVRYLRKKVGLSNKYKTKLETYPEILMYYMEETNKRIDIISNYEYEKTLTNIIQKLYGNQSIVSNDDKNSNNDIIIKIDDEEITYHVNFSDEKYSVNTKTNNKKTSNKNYNGTHHNHKKENEIKRLHGKIGEQLALEAEKKRLIKIGLEELVKDVHLVAQIDEETTLDGLGYDLISFNELREPICIEVKTSYGNKDKPFFISKKEIELIQGLKEEYSCKHCLIYYVLIDGFNVTIKNIHPYDFNTMKLTPILYKVG